MLQHIIIQFSLYYLPSGRLREVKNKRQFQTFSSNSGRGRGRLREVVAYKRFQIWWFDLETFGILENWSLRRSQPEVRLYLSCSKQARIFTFLKFHAHSLR